jgi:hypothetical protein
MSQIGVLIIHGIGAQTSDFADNFINAVRQELGPDHEPRVLFEPIFWANILEQRENRLWESMRQAVDPEGRRIPLDWRSIREFVVHNFGDATAYHRDHSTASALAMVHREISLHIAQLNARLGDPAAPIVVCAHSLGAHMMSNYIWDAQHDRARSTPLEPLPSLEAMITFGCNIPLFSLAFEKPVPIDLPGAGIVSPPLAAAARWLNYLDRDDVLGWPMKPLYTNSYGADAFTPAQARTVELIEDREINVGGLVSSWNPAAHNGYWTDDDFIRPVGEYLKSVLAAMDQQ